MYTISKQFHFSASHQLFGLGDCHPCARLHGHNYVVEVELSSETLDKNGFVIDYNDLGEFKNFIDDTLDHRHLNDILGDDGVTSEKLAKWLFDWSKQRWPEVSAMRISETPKTWAEYCP